MEKLIIWSFIAFVLLAVGGGFYLVNEENKKPTIEIKKDEWQCTSYKRKTHFVPVGKILTPITRQVCIEYKNTWE
jgi:hypothetical protein